MTKPRVLAVTSEPPWPLNSGGHIRSFHLMKAMAAATDFRLVCPVAPEQFAGVKSLRAAGIDVRPAAVPPRSKAREAKRLLGAALRGEPYVMYRRHMWREAAAVWAAELTTNPPDVLYLDHLDAFMYRAAAPGVPSVIDLHNVYSLLARRTAEEQTSRLKRAFLHSEAQRLGRIERVRRAGAAPCVRCRTRKRRTSARWARERCTRSRTGSIVPRSRTSRLGAPGRRW